jgi:hypothetical protein
MYCVERSHDGIKYARDAHLEADTATANIQSYCFSTSARGKAPA